jgi:uncharacterized membrane protein YccC
MPLPPAAEAAYSRCLAFSEKLGEALEDLDAAGVSALSPHQAERLVPFLLDVGAECSGLAAALRRTARRPADEPPPPLRNRVIDRLRLSAAADDRPGLYYPPRGPAPLV